MEGPQLLAVSGVVAVVGLDVGTGYCRTNINLVFVFFFPTFFTFPLCTFYFRFTFL